MSYTTGAGGGESMSLSGALMGSGMKESSSITAVRFCLLLFVQSSNSSSLLDRLYFFSAAAAQTRKKYSLFEF